MMGRRRISFRIDQFSRKYSSCFSWKIILLYNRLISLREPIANIDQAKEGEDKKKSSCEGLFGFIKIKDFDSDFKLCKV